uniref:Uncharacterized protein n=1 Tax=Arundo donax TaxID=35708 RepID=A0A0A9GBA2_ARUDO
MGWHATAGGEQLSAAAGVGEELSLRKLLVEDDDVELPSSAAQKALLQVPFSRT